MQVGKFTVYTKSLESANSPDNSKQVGKDYKSNFDNLVAEKMKNFKAAAPGLFVHNSQPMNTLQDLKVSGQFSESSPV